MTIDIQPHALGFFAYVTDGERLVACGEPKACPIEAVHVASERAIRAVLFQKVKSNHQSVEGTTDARAKEGRSKEAV